MKKRKLKKEDLDKIGDLNLDKVLNEISKINWDCLIRKTTILITRNILSRFGNIFTQPMQ
jgi:Fe-S cluster biosynthesis and repair protein YggX